MKQRILINNLSQKISEEISNILTAEESGKFEVRHKEDKTVVTNIDEKISSLVKSELKNTFGDHYNFYCEEDHGELSYPAVVLDPIDGTKGLVTGTHECAVSLAFMESPDISQGYGWIFNPFTGFSVASDDLCLKLENKQVDPPLGLVSRSEWEKGIYKDLELKDLILAPMGSIAFKLGLLATGACHFIVSAYSKNIWDIAAGSILCNQRNILLFDSKGDQLTKLEHGHIKGPMFWCKKEFAPRVLEIIKQRYKNEL
jgi:myo-inositol-1(or 4)-monophosphatase